jgi:S-DNA-T family DNA segregation ATPase FtsK/SpoIIIE
MFGRRSWDELAQHEEIEAARFTFREACISNRVCIQVDGVVAGTAFRTPTVAQVNLGPPLRMKVQMLAGMVPADIAAVGARIAPSLGGKQLRVTDHGHGWCTVLVLADDPLEVAVPGAEPARSALDPLLLGRGEDGQPITLELAGAAHLVVQGASGSGKSIGCYSLLSQLATVSDLAVTGSDITGLLLAPWQRYDIRPALGTRRPEEHAEVLEAVVAEMDDRIGQIPRGRDQVDLAEVPILLVVIEETPGLLRLLDATDKKIADRARLAMARILGEGRKAGVRLLLITQRADAKIIGAYERGQASHKLSFRVDTIDGLRMLHPDATVDDAAAHASAPPGVAMLSAPGKPLLRLKSPYVSYSDYIAACGEPPAGLALRVVS